MRIRRQQVYGTEAEAFARAAKLARDNGIWPGTVALPGGGYILSFDPPAVRKGTRAEAEDTEAEL